MKALIVALVTLLAAGVAGAQTWPAKPVSLVVPVPPSGATDIIARALAQRLTERWGKQVLVDNKPGANNQIGASFVAKAPPDGHTLLLAADSTFSMNPSLYRKLSYDAVRDFTPITGLARVDVSLVVHASVPAQNIREFLDLAKAKPGTINYGSYGIGSFGHLAMELLASMAGVKLVPVHYKGAAPAVTDVIAGHIQALVVAPSFVVQQAKAGNVRILAMASRQRLPQYPDVPTLGESGLPGYEAFGWFGLFAPSATPREIVTQINTDVQRVFNDPAFREQVLTPRMFEPIASSPEAFRAFVAAEEAKWGKVIRALNLQLD
jgi:tripartite-type tricarboxylate transporter receptor subunit TctC